MAITKKYPFKFLDAYSQADGDFFFGREEEVAALYEMVFQTNILLVYGASGTGKTSLIQCGLANRFQPYDWLALNIRRGTDINKSLRISLKEAEGPSAVEDEGDELLDSLFRDFSEQAETESELAKSLRKAYLNHFRPIYLIFDQFEELYILGSKAEQEKFITSVREILALQQPVKIIISIREEYLGYLYRFEKSIPQLLRKKLRVEPMNLDKVKQIIAGLAANTRSLVRIDPDETEIFSHELFEKIRGDERTIGIQLPYLQVYLDRIYLGKTNDESRRIETSFCLEDIRQVGEIGDVLRDFLEERVQKITLNLKPEYPRLGTEQLWEVLSLFVTLEGTKEPLDKKNLLQRFPLLDPLLLEKIINALVDNRILNFSENEELYEIAHDSLALQIAEKRTDEEIALLEIRRLIKSQTTLKEDAVELFSEKQLNFIEPYYGKLSLTGKERELIDKSKRNIDTQKRKKKKRIISAFVAVTVALVFMSGLAFLAFQSQQMAIAAQEDLELQKQEAISAKTAAEDALAARLRIEFQNLINRAEIITAAAGCPEEIIKQLDAIAIQLPDGADRKAEIERYREFCGN